MFFFVVCCNNHFKISSERKKITISLLHDSMYKLLTTHLFSKLFDFFLCTIFQTGVVCSSNIQVLYTGPDYMSYTQRQGLTGHRSNTTLVAGAFTISHTKCKKKELEEFRGPFEFFCMDGRRGLLIPVHLCTTPVWSIAHRKKSKSLEN
jgi:hypothetical protein